MWGVSKFFGDHGWVQRGALPSFCGLVTYKVRHPSAWVAYPKAKGGTRGYTTRYTPVETRQGDVLAKLTNHSLI